MDKLAIVIPAYKKKFFDQTLESFARQTCKNFTIYIGDDASAENIDELVEKYIPQIPIVYRKFELNLGGTDLVAQWERCIDLVKDEQWIWLFSDDDVASPDCVEGFFETIKLYDGEKVTNKVFRINMSITDKDLNPIYKYKTPDTFSVEYFLENYFIHHTFTNRAIEFIFSRSLYNQIDKIVNFPLAWGSDLATFLKLGQQDGFVTIIKGEVFWRSSGYNISGSVDPVFEKKKVSAYSQRILWIFGFIQNYSKNHFFYPIVYQTLHFIPVNQAFSKLKELNINSFKLKAIVVLLVVFIKIKRLIGYRKIKQRLIGLNQLKGSHLNHKIIF